MNNIFNYLSRFAYVSWNQFEKAKQDDALSDLSDILGDLKGMAVDMGSELNKWVAFFWSYPTGIVPFWNLISFLSLE